MKGNRRVRSVLGVSLGLAALIVWMPAVSTEQAAQQIVCEVSHVNAAWGFQHSGVYINPSGSIGEFKYSAADSRSVPNRGQTMSQSDLREKYRPGGRIIGKVCPEQMIWLRDQLTAIRYSPSSKPTHAAFDAGVQFTQCWIFASETAPGQHVLLRETGDFESQNLAESAPALANWLEAVARDARDNAHGPAQAKGCIAFPESLHQQYDQTVQQSEDDQNRAMEILRSAVGLRCQMGNGQWFGVYGTSIEQRATPENPELNYFQLSTVTGKGRSTGAGNDLHDVRISVTPTSIILEDTPMDGQATRTTTVVPYMIGGQKRFPAVVHDAMFATSGLVATTYVGTCTVIPRE